MPSTPSASASGDLLLYAHPFSSYCQKVLVALYENGTPFEWRLLSQEHPRVLEEFAALWPIGRFPVLVDAGRTIVEASTIIEYLGLHHPGPVPLLPADPRAAPAVRGLALSFDNYIPPPHPQLLCDRLTPDAPPAPTRPPPPL